MLTAAPEAEGAAPARWQVRTRKRREFAIYGSVTIFSHMFKCTLPYAFLDNYTVQNSIEYAVQYGP